MRILKKIRDILIVIILLFWCLFLYSEEWFLSTWDSSIDFSTVVYQLFSPLKGTGKAVMRDYINSCVYPAVFTIGIIMIIYVVLHKLIMSYNQKLRLYWKIRIGRKKFILNIQFRFWNILNYFGLAIIICVMSLDIYKKAVLMGAIDYIEEISQKSTIFEEEYVEPEKVIISFPKQKRNLILIYLESMETTYASVEEGGGKMENYIPELTRLAVDNISFSDDEDLGGASNVGGGWIMGALVASSSGAPYKLGIEGNTADRYEYFLPGITALGDILLDNGYQNYFICGSDVSYAGRKDFYQQHGDYKFIDLNTAREERFIPNDYDNGFWGMEDEKLFALAKEKLSDISKQNEPFNFTLLTVDTHHPDGYLCDYCGNQFDEQFANVLACSSKQVSEFIEWIQQQEWYENTSIVITGDHLSMKGDFWDDVGGYQRKIYNCFINVPDSIGAVQTKNRTFTVMDLFPSTLAAMGAEIEGERLGLGTNLFSEEQTIAEKIGLDELDKELNRYSLYYFQHFIATK